MAAQNSLAIHPIVVEVFLESDRLTNRGYKLFEQVRGFEVRVKAGKHCLEVFSIKLPLKRTLGVIQNCIDSKICGFTVMYCTITSSYVPYVLGLGSMELNSQPNKLWIQELLSAQRQYMLKTVIVWFGFFSDRFVLWWDVLFCECLKAVISCVVVLLKPRSLFLNPVREFVSSWRWKVYDCSSHERTKLLQATLTCTVQYGSRCRPGKETLKLSLAVKHERPAVMNDDRFILIILYAVAWLWLFPLKLSVISLVYSVLLGTDLHLHKYVLQEEEKENVK